MLQVPPPLKHAADDSDAALLFYQNGKCLESY